MQAALQILLPTADLSGADLSQQAHHAASERGDLQEMRQVVEQQQRRVKEVERARQVEASKHEQDGKQLRDELDELRVANGALRGDQQLEATENAMLKDRVVALEQQLATADEAGTAGEAGLSEGDPPPSSSGGHSEESHGGMGSAMVSQLTGSLQQAEQKLDALTEELDDLKEREVAVSDKNRELEAVLAKVSSKNRELQAKLASNEDTSSSRGDRVAELQRENTDLLSDIQETRARAAQARADADNQKRLMQEAKAESEAAFENASELQTKIDEQQAAGAAREAALEARVQVEKQAVATATQLKDDFEAKLHKAVELAKKTVSKTLDCERASDRCQQG
jgi:chromosome segregation ATPase